MNESNTESTWEPSDSFEQLLGVCLPAGGNQLEQMLYQAGWQTGWQAALAQQAQSVSLAEGAQVDASKRAKPGRTSSKNSMKWFGSGLGTGLAVSLLGALLVLNFAPSLRHPVQPQSDRDMALNLEGKTPEPLKIDGEAFGMVSPYRAEPRSREPLFDFRNSLFSWTGLLADNSRVREQSLRINRTQDWRGEIDWDVMLNSDRFPDSVWRDEPNVDGVEPVPSKTLYSRPLTQAQIDELL